MRSITTDVSVAWCVYYVRHVPVPCKNGRTLRGPVQCENSLRPKERCVRLGSQSPPNYFGHALVSCYLRVLYASVEV